MKPEKRIFVSILWVILGGVLTALSFAGITDAYWSGMGSGLLVVGIVQLLRYHRLNKNEAYREKREIELNDERNRFLRGKAWAWAGYLFILISALASIVLRILHQELLSLAASYAVCLMLILYWVSYKILQRKY